MQKFDYELYDKTPDDTILDISMAVYQHGKYVSQAIESVIGQQTKYKYRLMIFEDSSSDDSREIVKEYQKKYPEKIFLALSNENSQGKFGGYVRMTHRKSKYLAYLEGDDYWIDPFKIEKQIAFLENHPEYVGVTGNVMNINEDGTRQHRDFDLYGFRNSHIFTKYNVMHMEQVSHISAITHRNYRIDWSEEDFDKVARCRMNGDQILSATLGMMGDVYYSHEVYSHHRRVFTGDSWTARQQGRNNAENFIEMWSDLHDYIYEKYHEHILIEDTIKCLRDQIGKSPVTSNHVDERTKQRNIMRTMDMWLLSKNGGRNMVDILSEEGICRVAIYGMAQLGERLYFDLKDTTIEVAYGIDLYGMKRLPGIEIYNSIPEEEGPVDAVIVTALTTYDDIRDNLLKCGYNRVISLDEILYRMIPDDEYLKVKD